MFRQLLTLCAVLVCSSATAYAQTHPCDTPAPTSTSIPQNVPHKIQFCSPQTDNVEAAVAYVDGVASALQPVTAVGAKSPTSGLVLYETALFLSVANRGNHTLQLSTFNRDATGVSQEGAKSSPFVFAVNAEFPLSLSLTSDKASPQVKGAQVTFTATASGGVPPYSFKWLINGGLWTNWTVNGNVRGWDTSLATPGTYTIEVWARSSDNSADTPESVKTFTYVITAPTVPKPIAPVIRGLSK
jgi:hypothetical protein